MPRECKANYCWERKLPKSKCARGSVRTLVKKGGKVLVRVCCPKGPKHWRRGRCMVGLRAQAIGKRRR